MGRLERKNPTGEEEGKRCIKQISFKSSWNAGIHMKEDKQNDSIDNAQIDQIDIKNNIFFSLRMIEEVLGGG